MSDSECGSSDSDCCFENLQILSALVAAADACTELQREPPKHRKRLDWNEFRRQRVADGSFKRMFRMSEFQFDDLIGILGPVLAVDKDQARRATVAGHIPAELRLAGTLRYLAGGSYLDVFHLLGVGISSYYECINQVIEAINTAAALQLQFPQTASECASAARGFEARSAYGAFKV